MKLNLNCLNVSDNKCIVNLYSSLYSLFNTMQKVKLHICHCSHIAIFYQNYNIYTTLVSATGF